MTKQRTFKRRVRARMEKTGESYTAARRMLIEAGERPDPPAVEWTPPAKEESLAEATGHGWDHWLGVLDEWGANGRPHGEIASHLQAELGVAGWWAQNITVGYERARGMRVKGQSRDGTFSASVSRTIDVPVERLHAAWVDESVRERWLPGAEMRIRTTTAPKGARFDWEDGSTRLVVGFEPVGEGRAKVGMTHERLPDAETAEEMKAWWRERLIELKATLEATPGGS
ncbi:hypothetical protein HJD18_00930 [Thermoleophilia bacterium SCSIO 60948]|nr:hypothetical protein HJD18_00930 [Thermoleophilia bacterium SCSIO 60948]